MREDMKVFRDAFIIFLLVIGSVFSFVATVSVIVKSVLYPIQVEVIYHGNQTGYLPELETDVRFSGSVFSGCRFMGGNIICDPIVLPWSVNGHAFEAPKQNENRGCFTGVKRFYLI